MKTFRKVDPMAGCQELVLTWKAWSSITWDRGQKGTRLESMQGKSVLILFFQSWCPICNNWSGDMMKQLEQTYGDDPAVVLVALKTDGGSMKEAMAWR